MNTGPAIPTTPPDRIAVSQAKRPADIRTPSCDRLHVSEQAVLLSRNLAALREQLAPRPGMLEKFRAMAGDEPISVSDKTLDRLLDNLRGA